MTDRPNILFISSDSMDGRAMGCTGHPAAHTPHMDRLAERGVLFTHTYCNSPQCCPSRASMWSGRYVHQEEAWNNHKGLEAGAPTFQSRLDADGFRTHIVGKTDYLSGYHSLGARVTAWADPAGMQVTGLAARPQAVVVDEPHHDWKSIDASLAWLDAHALESDAPFMLYCGLNLPHPPFRTTQEWLDVIDPACVTVPPYEAEMHPVMDFIRVRKGCVGEFTDEELLAIRRTYYAMVAELDAMVGALVDRIDALGLTDSTYIIYISDHGDTNMEHRMHLKNSLYEGSARVPMMVAGPGIAPGGRVDALVSLVDIYPTLMDMAGLAHPEGLMGYSLMPELGGGANRERPDQVFSEYHSNFQNTSSFMLRRGDYKYIAYAGYESQLFHLGEDPDEMHSLVDERPEVAAEMAAGLREILDHEEVAQKVVAYDRAAFRAWRDATDPVEYHEAMSRFYRGWGPEKERIIEDWLARG
ncbi:MAG: sulfatase-like hydrolase/transferase [Chloroflexi bacterium]|nr:sulfatase-like hydrolase/transferase [Chloroflexota bacterium]